MYVYCIYINIYQCCGSIYIYHEIHLKYCQFTSTMENNFAENSCVACLTQEAG